MRRRHQQDRIVAVLHQHRVDRIRIVLTAQAAQRLVPTCAQGKQQLPVGLARYRLEQRHRGGQQTFGRGVE
jgi:hypothetical protein